MKLSTIHIRYDAEKLRILREYMKDEAALPTELEFQLQALYEQHVPAEVRETIDRRKEGTDTGSRHADADHHSCCRL